MGWAVMTEEEDSINWRVTGILLSGAIALFGCWGFLALLIAEVQR